MKKKKQRIFNELDEEVDLTDVHELIKENNKNIEISK